MEYKENDFYRMQNNGSQKMPFYMTYPMQNVLLEEADYERDLDRMKGMYPREVRQVQEYVEDECDKMEYEGSMMFDEYPDRLMLKQVCERIYQKMDQPEDYETQQYESVESEELRIIGPGRPGPGRPGPGFNPPPPPGFYPPPPPGHYPPPPPPGHYPPPQPPHGRPPRRNPGLQNLIEVLLYNEMYQRRCRHKRCRRWW